MSEVIYYREVLDIELFWSVGVCIACFWILTHVVNRDALKEQIQVIKDEAESTKVCVSELQPNRDSVL